jgi:hypothetical protein
MEPYLDSQPLLPVTAVTELLIPLPELFGLAAEEVTDWLVKLEPAKAAPVEQVAVEVAPLRQLMEETVLLIMALVAVLHMQGLMAFMVAMVDLVLL